MFGGGKERREKEFLCWSGGGRRSRCRLADLQVIDFKREFLSALGAVSAVPLDYLDRRLQLQSRVKWLAAFGAEDSLWQMGTKPFNELGRANTVCIIEPSERY